MTETFPYTLLPGQDTVYAFNTLYNFGVSQVDSTYTVCSWVDYVGDNVAYNDTSCYDVTSLGVPLAPTTTGDSIAYGTSATLTGAFTGNSVIR